MQAGNTLFTPQNQIMLQGEYISSKHNYGARDAQTQIGICKLGFTRIIWFSFLWQPRLFIDLHEIWDNPLISYHLIGEG